MFLKWFLHGAYNFSFKMIQNSICYLNFLGFSFLRYKTKIKEKYIQNYRSDTVYIPRTASSSMVTFNPIHNGYSYKLNPIYK